MDYTRFSLVGSESEQHGGQNKADYYLTLDAAKHVTMLERSETGKAIRQYFIDVETAAREASKTHPALKAQMDEAATLLAGVLAENKALRPAADLGNVVTKGRTSWPINMAAKELGVSRDDLRSVLIAASSPPAR